MIFRAIVIVALWAAVASARPFAPFALRAVNGGDLSSVDWNEGDKTATVVVFLSARCPCSMGHEERLSELARRFKNFAFVGVHANADEPAELVRRHFTPGKFPFPVLDDADQTVADRFGAVKTPHVFVVDRAGNVQFEGGVDDSRLALDAKKHYLEDALARISRGESPETKVVKTLGCSIRRLKRAS